MQKLLDEGGYTRRNKANGGVYTAISTGYWLLVPPYSRFTPSARTETGRQNTIGLSGQSAACCTVRLPPFSAVYAV